MTNSILWLGTLVVSIIISTFAHELGHGISCYLSGIRVSTGFNKVGDLGKKPSDVEFRMEYDNSPKMIWDLGVPITLLIAMIFSNLLRVELSTKTVIIVGAVGYTNSLMRLIPCGNALWGVIKRGRLNLEDEVGLGQALKEKYEIKILRYIPLAISIIVSLYTLDITLNLLNQKASWLFDEGWTFTAITVLALWLGTNICEWLDERYRIDWER
ncbi:hypothetical protein GOQ27_04600 [Clostridium sp. D2Q-11]|uniref:Uncharacterized protein n=1 Tax=Anaeromonas frigoriresistens TaxID=2683708 RepID=A0A942Z892_9FIRM|nr:hypothetical protein [Anaeromonas frigoriresistens]MBS4537729.1 hypothetical protein [Anaeromonas frigoriresistens]